MALSEISRRGFVASLTALGISAAGDGWVNLFNGRTLQGWQPRDNSSSWKVVDGQVAAQGPQSLLFYTGPVNGANFRNFELEVQVLSRPGGTSGVWFHAKNPRPVFPDQGFGIQINNTAKGELSKTGSLLPQRYVYKQFVPDDQWFTIHAAVRGKNVQIRLDGMLVVDYTEPVAKIVLNLLDHGTFALWCKHNVPQVRFRNIRVRPLPDDLTTPGGPPPPDDPIFRQILDEGRRNIPMADLHVHLKNGLTLEAALAKSRRDGIEYGIAVNCGPANTAQNDQQAVDFVESLKGQPCFIAMQAEGREWTQMFSRRAAARFDYIFTDSMTWTDNRGKRMRLWMPDEVGIIGDVQEFMDTFVERTVSILEHEPIDIYANPTYLPDQIAKDYEQLWTEERRRKVIQAAVRNHVSIELNSRRNLPSPSFVRMAKALGAKFNFGTNNAGADDLGRSEYGLRMVEECNLGQQDFFVPLSGPKAIERKGDALL